MTDTARELSALQTLLADNTSKAISAQDLRDFLVSALGGYGGLACAAGSTPQTVNIASAKLTAWNTALPSADTTPSTADDQITIDVAGDYLVDLGASFLATAGRNVKLQIYKNGSAVAGASTRRLSSSGTDIGTVSIGTIVTCAATDVITVYVSADVDSTSITVSEATLSVKRLS